MHRLRFWFRRGYFTVDSSGYETPEDHGLYISNKGSVVINEGIFNGIISDENNISTYLGNECHIYDYDTGDSESGEIKDIKKRVEIGKESTLIKAINVNVIPPANGKGPVAPTLATNGVEISAWEWYSLPHPVRDIPTEHYILNILLSFINPLFS